MSKWSELSNNAKSIIEWVECPREKDFNVVSIKVGEKFERPKYGVRIVVTQKLLDEIRRYVQSDGSLHFLNNNPNDISFEFTTEYKQSVSISHH